MCAAGAPKGKFLGMAYESRADRYTSHATVRVTSPGARHQVYIFIMRTSGQDTDHEVVLHQRDATMLWLTQGTYRHLSRVETEPRQKPMPMPKCVAFAKQVLNYNAEVDMFLLKDGWQKALDRHSIVPRPMKLDVSFSASCIVPDMHVQDPTAQSQAPSSSQHASVATTEVVPQPARTQQSVAMEAGAPGLTSVPATAPAQTVAQSIDMVTLEDFERKIRSGDANVLLCGAAGSGKSHVMKEHVRKVLDELHGDDAVWITATTGMAAIGVDGSTLHSMAGMGLGKGTAEQIVKAMQNNIPAVKRWDTVKAIVIEECSMLSAEFFDKMHAVACIMRPQFNDKAFAGISMVLVGDFAQLAPIADLQQDPSVSRTTQRIGPYRRPEPKYLFESKIWAAAEFVPYRLSYCWRYDIDSELGVFLTKLRVSETLHDSLFTALVKKMVSDEQQPETCVRLVTKKKEAHEYSIKKLHDIQGGDASDHMFYAVDCQGDCKYVNTTADESGAAQRGGGPDHYTDEHGCPRSLYNSMVCDPVLRLRLGAKVLCVKSIDDNVKTSTMGTVGWVAMAAKVATGNLDKAELGHNVTAQQAKCDWPHVNAAGVYPVVRFCLNGAETAPVVTPRKIELQDNIGNCICSRLQLPLILAYAVTVHRAQGLTLDSVLFDISSVWCEGQLYTALSRVRDFSKLFIKGNVSSKLVCASKKVVNFEASTPWTVIDNRPSNSINLM